MTRAPKLLVVDDNATNRYALEKALKHASREVLLAPSGEDALSVLLDHDDIDLILLDVMMPGMDGFETAQLIRGSRRSKHIPIIFTSGISQDNIRHFEGDDQAPVKHVPKPIDLDVLIHTIEECLTK